ncbi:PDR/VanB family oxidoreductase [Paraburkholderia sp.]|uniref:PDR/VanB family oxidoreductase n=1 Tax=Paraburkholderia sp. TaxID=1926495 RepID=UPI0023A4170D|nr:PDR/VanB family oxidoreductase [Paraburkholderia sp.]MDE1180013.1 PDR/VanB family oxidoreductase [Paraburkholderia sp.]
MSAREAITMDTGIGLSLRVARRFEVAHDIVAFDLEAADYLPLPPFEAGAHLEIDCNGQRRHYSLCSDPADSSRYTIAVQHERNGRGGSRYLCETLRVNDTLDALGPRNHFAMTPATRPPLLIAGGIGITPVMSMAWSLHHAGIGFEMHDFASSAARQAFVDEIGRAPWAGKVTRHLGRCTDFTLLTGGFEPGRHLYVCGPFAMIDAVLGAARAMGWPEDHLHCERFAAPSSADRSDADSDQANQPNDLPFEVELASSGRRVPVAVGQSVCAALAGIGVHVPMSCEQGVCGSCTTRVLAGTPDHRDWILSADEQASGTVFTPCCSRAKTPLLVLDL